MPRTIVIEDFWEWEKRHGGKGYHIQASEILKDFPEGRNRFVFPDGATCSAENADIRWEPPVDPIMNLRFRRAYAAEVLSQLRLRFQRIAEAAHLNPSESGLQSVKEAKAAVINQRLVWTALDNEYTNLVSETPAAKQRVAQEKLNIERAAERTRLQEEIRQIVAEV
jgi:hypothetical protein